jgi:predicted alpha/beta-fold hydrolase
LTTAAQFQPRRWLRKGHLQTIVGNFLPRIDRLPAATTEFVPVPLPAEMLTLPSAVALDHLLPSKILCHCHWQPERNDAVTVVLVHGLEGSSHSQYIIGNANKLFAAGCSVVRMNMRNCGGTDALSPMLYHSGMSGDVKAVLTWLIDSGSTRVILAGYSMGGNLVLKAVGELAECAPVALIGSIAVSPPMDLGESADALHHWTNRIYERRFLRGLIKRYRRKAKLYPAVFHTDQTQRVRSIRDFDEYVMTPYCGFTGASDYYTRSGAGRVLDTIAVPTLILHACDDPFIRLTPSTRMKLQTNANITLLEPAHGGHCAFLEEPREGYDGYWAEAQLLQFVRACAPDTARKQVPLC